MKKFLALLLAVVMLVTMVSCGGEKKESQWSEIILYDVLPEFPSDSGEIVDNSLEGFEVYLKDITAEQFADYKKHCKDASFTVDAESDSYSFYAYNSDGYELDIYYYEDEREMDVELTAPMKLSVIQWPKSTAGQLLPVPESLIGKFSYDSDDGFYVYIGETTEEAYNEYVTACYDNGFNVDYDKGDDYYYADNGNGWELSLCYEGNNIMSIDIYFDSYYETDDTTASLDTEVPETEAPETEAPNSAYDWKQFLKDYEAWVDEYIAFMKKYKSNPSDLSLLADYATMMSEYAEWADKVEEMDDDLSTAEALEYSAELSRIAAKLAQAAY